MQACRKDTLNRHTCHARGEQHDQGRARSSLTCLADLGACRWPCVGALLAGAALPAKMGKHLASTRGRLRRHHDAPIMTERAATQRKVAMSTSK